jgi:hypothetical protein
MAGEVQENKIIRVALTQQSLYLATYNMRRLVRNNPDREIADFGLAKNFC